MIRVARSPNLFQKTRWTRSFAVFLVALTALGADPMGLAGTWDLEIQTPAAGNSQPILMLQQVGTALEGIYIGKMGRHRCNGTVIGGSVKIKVLTGNAELTFDGKASSDGRRISGIVKLQFQPDGHFSAVRR